MAYTTIDDPSAYFKVQLYTGTGSTLAVTFNDTDTDMQPDLIWIKVRNQSSSGMIQDSVRGTDGTSYRALKPSADTAESTNAGFLTTIGSDGFTVGTNGKFNASSDTYVAWCWKESATAGLDIVSYTGNATARTISHNLSAVPHTMWCKERSANAPFGNQAWSIYHKSITANKYMVFNANQAEADDAADFNDTDPTSSVFSVGNGNRTNASSGSQIAYVFAPIQGFSKFGTYIGNGDSSGPYIHLGFKPAYVLIKRTDSTTNWYIFDNKRLGYNPDQNMLYVEINNAEGTTDAIDFVSNGFKLRHTDTGYNGSGSEYIYWAWAEAPFVNSEGVPCNAR